MCGQALSGASAQPACLVVPALFISCVCVGSVNRSAGRRPASLNPFYISILKSNVRRTTSFLSGFKEIGESEKKTQIQRPENPVTNIMLNLG